MSSKDRNVPYGGVLLSVVIAVLVGGYVHFHYPQYEYWQPTTFTQFVLFLLAGLAYFIGTLALEAWFRGEL